MNREKDVQKSSEAFPVNIYHGLVREMNDRIERGRLAMSCVKSLVSDEGDSEDIYWKSHHHAYTLERSVFWILNSFICLILNLMGHLAVNLCLVFIDRE